MAQYIRRRSEPVMRRPISGPSAVPTPDTAVSRLMLSGPFPGPRGKSRWPNRVNRTVLPPVRPQAAFTERSAIKSRRPATYSKPADRSPNPPSCWPAGTRGTLIPRINRAEPTNERLFSTKAASWPKYWVTNPPASAPEVNSTDHVTAPRALAVTSSSGRVIAGMTAWRAGSKKTVSDESRA